MLKYELGCELNYSIGQPSTLILNIGVVSNDYQSHDIINCICRQLISVTKARYLVPVQNI